MSVQNAAEFMIKIGEDNDLAAQIQEFQTAQELIDFAHTQGYKFSESDLKDVESVLESDELSEEQLEAVAGGGLFDRFTGFVRRNEEKIRAGYDIAKTIYRTFF